MAADAAWDGQTALALRLVKLLAPSPPGTTGEDGDATNVAFSTVSVHAALALLAAGARGATQAQLLAFLGASSAACLADFGRRVADRVLADRSDSGGPRVLFGGGVWVDASRGGLTDAFHDVASESYKSEARTVSFTKEPVEAVKMINEWVKKATDNLISTIISPDDIDDETVLVLANAVHFKAEWPERFHSVWYTRLGLFHRLNGSCSEAAFMSRNLSWLHVACMDGFKVLRLPYKPESYCRQAKAKATGDDTQTQYSMFIFLPDARDSIATMMDVVTAAPAFLYSILAGMKKKLVDLNH